MKKIIMTNKDKSKIKNILIRYTDGIYTEKDVNTLIKEIKQPENHADLEDSMRKIWEESEFTDTTEIQREQYGNEVRLLLNRVPKRSKIRFPQTFLKYAATIATLIISIWTVYFLSAQHRSDSITYTTINVANGKHKHVVLPDGTKVIMNAGSHLRYPDRFTGDTRLVEMDGEAFFDVTKDPKHTFIIQTTKAEIKVLGTSLNVKAYNEDEEMSVSVKTGKVQVEIENAILKLLPDEHLTFDKSNNEYQKRNESAQRIISWIEGRLYFNKTPIRSVALELQRIYNCKIEFASNAVYDEYIYGEHENVTLESVLKSIHYSTGIQYKRDGDKIILYKD